MAKQRPWGGLKAIEMQKDTLRGIEGHQNAKRELEGIKGHRNAKKRDLEWDWRPSERKKRPWGGLKAIRMQKETLRGLKAIACPSEDIHRPWSGLEAIYRSTRITLQVPAHMLRHHLTAFLSLDEGFGAYGIESLSADLRLVYVENKRERRSARCVNVVQRKHEYAACNILANEMQTGWSGGAMKKTSAGLPMLTIAIGERQWRTVSSVLRCIRITSRAWWFVASINGHRERLITQEQWHQQQ